MKFTLSRSGYHATDVEKQKFERLGFRFARLTNPWGNNNWRMDGPSPTIEITTIDELVKFIDDIGYNVVISRDGDGFDIEIYDDYRE